MPDLNNENIYEIFWDGPFNINELNEYAEEEPQLASYWSLYAKYEDHPLYGRHVLTYIGKAEEQPVLTRLKQHNLDREKVYVGVIYDFKNWETSNEIFDQNWEEQKDNIIKDKKVISRLEELLIFSLWHAGNKRNKWSANKSWPYRIFNTGNKGSIPDEISGHYTIEKTSHTLKVDNNS